MKYARPLMLLFPAAIVLASFSIASEGHIRHDVLVPMAFAVFFHAFGAVLNDAFDVERDKGRPGRLVAAGVIKARDAFIFATALWTTSMAMLTRWAGNVGIACAALIASIMAFIYDSRAKRHALWGNIVFGITVCIYPIVGWYASGRGFHDAAFVFIALGIFLMGLTTSATNNFSCWSRDLKIGYRTLATVYGVKKAAFVLAPLRGLLVLSIVMVLIAGGLINAWTVAVVIGACVLAGIIHRLLLRGENVRDAENALKLNMVFNFILLLLMIIGAIAKTRLRSHL
jgi:4-hydroxybenzoate polyprenyltransferase